MQKKKSYFLRMFAIALSFIMAASMVPMSKSAGAAPLSTSLTAPSFYHPIPLPTPGWYNHVFDSPILPDDDDLIEFTFYFQIDDAGGDAIEFRMFPEGITPTNVLDNSAIALRIRTGPMDIQTPRSPFIPNTYDAAISLTNTYSVTIAIDVDDNPANSRWGFTLRNDAGVVYHRPANVVLHAAAPRDFTLGIGSVAVFSQWHSGSLDGTLYVPPANYANHVRVPSNFTPVALPTSAMYTHEFTSPILPDNNGIIELPFYIDLTDADGPSVDILIFPAGSTPNSDRAAAPIPMRLRAGNPPLDLDFRPSSTGIFDTGVNSILTARPQRVTISIDTNFPVGRYGVTVWHYNDAPFFTRGNPPNLNGTATDFSQGIGYVVVHTHHWGAGVLDGNLYFPPADFAQPDAPTITLTAPSPASIDLSASTLSDVVLIYDLGTGNATAFTSVTINNIALAAADFIHSTATNTVTIPGSVIYDFVANNNITLPQDLTIAVAFNDTATTVAQAMLNVWSSGVVAPAGFRNIVVEAETDYDVQHIGGAASVVYVPPILSDNGIIVFPFSITPTLQQAGSNPTFINITPAGFIGSTPVNRYFTSHITRRAPIQLDLSGGAARELVIRGCYNVTYGNIINRPWEVGNTYDLIVFIDTRNHATDDITFTVEVWHNGVQINSATTSAWQDIPLRREGSPGLTLEQRTVRPEDRAAFVDGIGRLTISRWNTPTPNAFVFTVPDERFGFIDEGGNITFTVEADGNNPTETLTITLSDPIPGTYPPLEVYDLLLMGGSFARRSALTQLSPTVYELAITNPHNYGVVEVQIFHDAVTNTPAAPEPVEPGPPPIPACPIRAADPNIITFGPGGSLNGFDHGTLDNRLLFRYGIPAGTIVYIYPNYGNGYWFTAGHFDGFSIVNDNVEVRGVMDADGNRPILLGDRSGLNTADPRGVFNIIQVEACDVIVRDLVVDGGIFPLIHFLNGESCDFNPFGANHIPAYNRRVTFENLHEFFNTESPLTEGPATLLNLGNQNTLRHFVAQQRTNGFAHRGVFHVSGNNLLAHNLLIIGSADGVVNSNHGPGTLIVEYSEIAYNGTGGGLHGVYIVGDFSTWPEIEIIFRYNVIRHSITFGSHGFRSRMPGTRLINNVFFDNSGVWQVDLVSGFSLASHDPVTYRVPGDHKVLDYIYAARAQGLDFMESRFNYRYNVEVIGNLFVRSNAPAARNANHVQIGGGGSVFEETLGRYRFLNNTFVDLAGPWGGGFPTAAIAARGVESVEMYNNIFYANHSTFLPFFNPLLEDATVELVALRPEWQAAFDIHGWVSGSDPRPWAIGEIQISGSHNWVSETINTGLMPFLYGGGARWFYPVDELFWDNTIHGSETPFISLTSGNIKYDDFRIAPGSSADAFGVPVGIVYEFQTEASFNALRDAGKLPVWDNWEYVADGAPPHNIVAGTVTSWIRRVWETQTTFLDGYFQRPTTEIITSPPFMPAFGAIGTSWDAVPRSDSPRPRIGAFGGPLVLTQPEFGWNIFNNGPGGTQYPRPNPGLAASGTIRMWTQLDGVNAPIYLDPADTIVALDQDGECAMEFVRINRVWVAGTGWANYFNMVDVNKNGQWQYINLYITVYGEIVHVLLANALFEPPTGDVTVTFVVEAGAVGVYAAATTTVVVPAGEEIPASAIPSTETRTGFYFAGWYPSDPAGYVVTKDITFTARFNPLFHYVTFEAGNGGELIPASGFGLVVSIRDGFAFWADRVPTPVPDAGYAFIGWYPADPAGFVVRESMTFTAVFAELVPVAPRIISVTPNPAIVERGGVVELVVTTQGMPDGAWIDLNLWRTDLSVVGGTRFYIVDNQATITIAAAENARLGRDGFSVTARTSGDWGSVVIIANYSFVIEVM